MTQNHLRGTFKCLPFSSIFIFTLRLFLVERMKNRHGNYTEKTVQRCAEMGGAFGKKLNTIMTGSGLADFTTNSQRGNSHKKSLGWHQWICKEYKKDRLFMRIPGRFHHGLRSFRMETPLKDPEKLGRKMMDLAKEIDGTGKPEKRNKGSPQTTFSTVGSWESDQIQNHGQLPSSANPTD